MREIDMCIWTCEHAHVLLEMRAQDVLLMLILVVGNVGRLHVQVRPKEGWIFGCLHPLPCILSQGVNHIHCQSKKWKATNNVGEPHNSVNLGQGNEKLQKVHQLVKY